MSWKDRTTGERVASAMLGLAMVWYGCVLWLGAVSQPESGLHAAYLAMALVAGAVGLFIGLIVAIAMLFIGGDNDHGKFRRVADRFLPLGTVMVLFVALQMSA